MSPHFPNWLVTALEVAVSYQGEEWKLGHKLQRVVKAVGQPLGAVTVMVGGQGRIASLLIWLVGLQQELGEREEFGSALVVESE